MSTKAEKVLILGLDCCEPRLAFEKYLPHLPNLKRLMIRSCSSVHVSDRPWALD